MKQNLKYIIPGIILFLGIFGVFSHRFDLTKEKRYTLSDATVETLKSVKEPLTVEVYLEGDFPASFKQLQNETQFLLEEFSIKRCILTWEFLCNKKGYFIDKKINRLCIKIDIIVITRRLLFPHPRSITK